MTPENTQTTQWKDMPIQGKIQLIQLLALFPALTVMVFIRYRLGYRLVKPAWLLIMALIMVIVPNVIATGNRSVPFGYALLMLGVGLAQRHIRWRGLCRNERLHTYATGISWLETGLERLQNLKKVRLPAFLFNMRRIYRFLDPLACYLAGLLVWWLGSWGLAAWILFAAMSLTIWEQGYFDRLLNRALDLRDGILDSEVQQEEAAHYQQNPNAAPLSLRETGGLPTGMARDIQPRVQENQQGFRRAD